MRLCSCSPVSHPLFSPKAGHLSDGFVQPVSLTKERERERESGVGTICLNPKLYGTGRVDSPQFHQPMIPLYRGGSLNSPFLSLCQLDKNILK